MMKYPHFKYTGKDNGTASTRSSKDPGTRVVVIVDGVAMEVPLWALVGHLRNGAFAVVPTGMNKGEMMELLWKAGYPQPGEPFPEL